MRAVEIGSHRIGPGNPPFFVAELGICHGGDVREALALTRAAAAAGAHCVKTETFQRKTLVYDPSATTSYAICGKKITVPLAEHMDKYELSYDEHRQVKALCDTLNVPFMSTAHDFNAVDFLVDIGAAAIKISSPDIVHYPLLRYVAKTGSTLFLDTGSALQYEIEIAVKTLREAGAENIVVNHNPDGHPAPADCHDLRIISRLQDILDVPVGIADHYEEYDMARAAVAAGAHAVEKPISRDRFVPEPERNYSVSIEDLPDFVRSLNEFFIALGRPERRLSETQLKYRDTNRMALVSARDLPAGAPVDFDNVTFGRPRKGIGVEFWDQAKGLRTRRPIQKGAFLQWSDLE